MGNVGGKSGLTVDPLKRPAEVVESTTHDIRDVILGGEQLVGSVIVTGEKEIGQTVRTGITTVGNVITEAEKDITQIVSETETNILTLILDTEQNITQTIDLVIIGGVVIAALVIYSVSKYADKNPEMIGRIADLAEKKLS